MKAYHLRTTELDPTDFAGLETYTLNSIYIPDNKVLLGFIKWRNLRGRLVDNSHHLDRAECIVDNNRNGVLGNLVAQVDMDEKVAKAIKNNNGWLNQEGVKVTKYFDERTETLIGILSGQYIAKGIGGNISRWIALHRKPVQPGSIY